MVKIIFLDIDGPVLPGKCMFLPEQTMIMTLFCPVTVSLLNRLCSEYGWQIVIHSSWIKPVIMGEAETVKHCQEQGILPDHILGTCDGSVYWRYTRVAKWLQEHPEVTNYVILDDEPFEDDKDPTMAKRFPLSAEMFDRHILVDYMEGFTWANYIQIVNRSLEV